MYPRLHCVMCQVVDLPNGVFFMKEVHMQLDEFQTGQHAVALSKRLEALNLRTQVCC